MRRALYGVTAAAALVVLLVWAMGGAHHDLEGWLTRAGLGEPGQDMP